MESILRHTRIFFTTHWKTLLCILSIVAMSYVAMISLATPGLFTSHDGEAHLTRLIQFHQALNDGQFPPRWASGFMGGIGSPVLMLNYHFPYIVADIFVRTGLTYIDAFKFTLALSYVFSGILAFIAFKTLYGTLSGITGALLYLWAPYRFVDIYVRAAFGESFAFIFPPLIVLGIARSSLLLMTAGFAGLFLSHPVASAMFTPFFLGYALIHYGVVQKNIEGIKKTLLAFVLSFAIASFNLIPTLTLTRYTHYTPTNTTPLEHFPGLSQLLFETWGYAGSTPNDEHEYLSYHIGYAHLIVIAITVLTLAYVRAKSTLPKSAAIPAWVLLCVSITFFLMQHISTPLWQFLHLPSFFDFPWRMLLFMTFATTYSGAWLVHTTPKPLRVGIFLFIVSLAVRSNLNHIRINAIWPWGVEHYFNNFGTGDAYGEYASQTRFSQFEYRVMQRIDILQGKANVSFEKNISQYIVARIDAQTPTKIRLNVMHFPGWEYMLDEQRVELGKQCALSPYTGTNPPKNDVPDTSGLLECSLKPGTHKLIADFTSPTMQTVGNLVSLAGLGALLWNLYPLSFLHLMKRRTSSRSAKK